MRAGGILGISETLLTPHILDSDFSNFQCRMELSWFVDIQFSQLKWFQHSSDLDLS